MSHEKFENHLRKSLSGHRSPMDTNAFWAALEAKRRRKRRIFFFWIPIGVLALSAFGVAGWYLSTDGPLLTDHSGTLVEVEVTPPNVTESIPVPVEGMEAETQDQRAPSVDASPQEAPTIQAPGKVPAAGTIPTSSTVEQPAKLPEQLPAEQGMTSPSIFLMPDTGDPSAPDQAAVPNIPKEEVSDVEGSAPRWTSLLPAEVLSFRLEYVSSYPLRDLPAKEAERNTITPHTPRWTISLGAEAGVAMPNRRFSEGVDSLGGEFLLARQSHERPLEVVQGGLNVILEHRSGFGIRTGLRYSQFAEQLNYEQSATSSWEDSLGLVRIYEYEDGSREEVYGPTTVTQVENQRIVHYNYYRFVDIPIALRYRFASDGPLSLFLEGGASINLWKQASGRIIGREAQEPVFLGEEEPYFRKVLLPELFGSVGLQWRVNERFSLRAQPEFRFRLGSITPDEYPIQHRVGSLGIQLGAYWQL
jgi:hypothetical protein